MGRPHTCPPRPPYRLEADKLEGRHFGEASCREYRESVMHVLPHSWTHPLDTWLQVCRVYVFGGWGRK